MLVPQMSRPRSQFNAAQLQFAIGLGWWVLGKTDFSSSSHHLIMMMKVRRRGQLIIMEHATTEQRRGKIYLLAQYKCNSDMNRKSKHRKGLHFFNGTNQMCLDSPILTSLVTAHEYSRPYIVTYLAQYRRVQYGTIVWPSV